MHFSSYDIFEGHCLFGKALDKFVKVHMCEVTFASSFSYLGF